MKDIKDKNGVLWTDIVKSRMALYDCLGPRYKEVILESLETLNDNEYQLICRTDTHMIPTISNKYILEIDKDFINKPFKLSQTVDGNQWLDTANYNTNWVIIKSEVYNRLCDEVVHVVHVVHDTKDQDTLKKDGGTEVESEVFNYKGNKYMNFTETIAFEQNKRKLVTVSLLDNDPGLDDKESLVALFENVITNGDQGSLIHEIIMNHDIKGLLEEHNDRRVNQLDKDIRKRTGHEVPLLPVELKDLTWVVTQ